MIEILIGSGGLIVGAGIGGAIAWGVLHARRTDARARAEMLGEQLEELRTELAAAREGSDAVDRRREEAERRLAALEEQLRQRETQFAEQKALLADAEKRLADSFSALGARALAANNEQFVTLASRSFEKLLAEAKGDTEKRHQAIDGLVKPIRELLEKQQAAIGELEKRREGAYEKIHEKVRAMGEAHAQLRQETGRLVGALRRPKARGNWGEFQLRNVVEMAGMTRYCDFIEQAATDDAASRKRPDLTVRMPGGGTIVVDSKVALDHYLDVTTDPESDRDAKLRLHAQAMDRHVNELAKKEYQQQFERSPDFTVMFVRLESALVAALDARPDLIERAMRRNVIIVTPTLLLALLQAVAHGWRQEDVAANAREISETGRELYRRTATFVDHLRHLRRGLSQAVGAFNSAAGSLESSVLPQARRFVDLGAAAPPEIEALEHVAEEPRVPRLPARDEAAIIVETTPAAEASPDGTLPWTAEPETDPAPEPDASRS